VHNAGGNIRAGGAGGHPDPDDAIDISIEDVEAVLVTTHQLLATAHMSSTIQERGLR
jgi:hypothetical protein